MLNNSSICPCGNSPVFSTTKSPGTDKVQAENFLLTSFGAHLVSHLKGSSEFNDFKKSVNKHVEQANQNRHKDKQEETPEYLMKSVLILQRTCKIIASRNSEHLYNIVLNSGNASNTAIPERADVKQAHKRMNETIIFLETAKQSIQQDSYWRCSIQ